MKKTSRLMKSTLKATERYWERRLKNTLIPEDLMMTLYTELIKEINQRQFSLAWQQGYDAAFLTTSVIAGVNPYDVDSTEYDYFDEGMVTAGDDLAAHWDWGNEDL